MNKATLIDVLVYEAIRDGLKDELTKLREFYRATTAPGVMLHATHAQKCPFDSRHACGCGWAERQARIDKAIAALAEVSEDDASEVTG